MVSAARTFIQEILQQIRSHWRIILLAYLPPFLFLFALGVQREIPMRHLADDTFAIANLPAHVGLISNLGILTWAAAFGVCVFATVVLWGRSSWGRFFAASTLLTLVLLLDDMFMLHDRVLPRFGITELGQSVLYILIALGYTVYFWRFLSRTSYALLFIAVGLLGLSIVMDVMSSDLRVLYYALQGRTPPAQLEPVPPPTYRPTTNEAEAAAPAAQNTSATAEEEPSGLIPRGNLALLIEDGSKLLGIVGWLYYFGLTARRCILAVMEDNVIPAVDPPIALQDTPEAA